MSQARNLSLNSPLNQKSNCCEAMLLSLLQRIEELQGRLKDEVEHRENDFNDVLRLLVKDKVQSPTNMAMQPFLPFKASKSKLKVSNDANSNLKNKKQAIKNVLNRRANTRLLANSKMISHSEQKEAVPSSINDDLKAIQCRTKFVEQNLQQHQAALDKMKELNDYLMDQLLLIFQKIKNVEGQPSLSKEITSLQTVTSMLIEGQAKKQHNELINKQFNSEIDLINWEKVQFSDLKQKVAQHEAVLSELIQITREVSGQIAKSPRQQIQPKLLPN